MRCDIIAYEGSNKNFFDKAIKFFTSSSISHVSIMLGDKFMMESMTHGVKLSEFSDRGGKYHILRHKNLSKKQMRDIIKFILGSVDTAYDYKLIIGILLNRCFGIKTNFDNPKKYICSELIIEAYRNAGIELLPGIPDKDIIPSDLLTSPELIEVCSL